jgi:hypothetical protein
VLSLGSSSSAQPNAPKPPAADLFVSVSGSDASRCIKSAPCATFNRAYRVAKEGDIVEVAGGAYPEQQIDPDPAKRSANDVVIRPAAGAKVTMNGPLKVYASHVTVERMSAADLMIVGEPATGVAQSDVTAKSIAARTLQVDSATGVTVTGGNFGPSEDNNSGIRKNGPTMTGKVVIDGASFHDYRCAGGANCHIECLIVGAVDGLTVRNSRFTNCAIYNIFFQGFNGPISNVTLTRNWFSAPTGPDGQGVWPHAVRFSADYVYTNVLVQNNSFLRAFSVGGGASNFRVLRNIGPLDERDPPGGCGDRAISYQQNLWENGSCSSTDGRAPFGYALEQARLKAAKPQSTVITSIFGQAKGGRTLPKIAQQLRQTNAPAPEGSSWDAVTVRKLLADPVYLGNRYGATGAHPPLVTVKTWRQVQKRLSSR